MALLKIDFHAQGLWETTTYWGWLQPPKSYYFVPLYVTFGNSRNEKYIQTSITGRNVDLCARRRPCPPPPKAKIAALYGSHQVVQPGSARMAHGDYSQGQAMIRKGVKSIFLVTGRFPIHVLKNRFDPQLLNSYCLTEIKPWKNFANWKPTVPRPAN